MVQNVPRLERIQCAGREGDEEEDLDEEEDEDEDDPPNKPCQRNLCNPPILR